MSTTYGIIIPGVPYQVVKTQVARAVNSTHGHVSGKLQQLSEQRVQKPGQHYVCWGGTVEKISLSPSVAPDSALDFSHWTQVRS